MDRRRRLPQPRRAATVVMLALVVGLLGACDGDGSVPRPTGLPSRSDITLPTISATKPTPTRTLPTRPSESTAEPEPTETQPTETEPTETQPTETQPTETEPTETEPTETEPTKTQPTETEPTETETQPTETEPTETETQPTATQGTTPASTTTPSSTPTTSAPAEASGQDDATVPSWVWWLLAALVVAAAVGIPLLVRSSRRRAWREELAEAETEVGWFAHDLMPTLLRARSADELRGAWTVGQDRVAAVQQHLEALTASARDDAGRSRAGQLHQAVQSSSDRIGRLAAGESTAISQGLAEVTADLDSALAPPPPTAASL